MTASLQARYSKGAMIFHWSIAIAVIVNWRLAEAAAHAAKADAGWYMAQHKAIGISILILSIGRLAWRLTHPAPSLPVNYAAWERILARGLHIVFYVMLIGLPIGGWLASSYFGRGVDMFGLFTVPALPVSSDPEMGKTVIGFHGTGAEALVYLVALHVLGALKHTFYDRDGGIYRMLPFGKAG
ncbi:cytochrome b [Pontixanthobacter sp.]|uniref:cytochrome b n=1 Tax=Pontixanthobacter sp. TaxID=2792078 RepID=UPI003C7A3350